MLRQLRVLLVILSICNVNDDSIRAVPLLNSECQFCLWRLAWIDATNVSVVFNSALKHETVQFIIRTTSKCLLRWLWRHINGEGCCLEEGRTVSGRPSCDANHTPEAGTSQKIISSNKLAMKWTCFAIIIQFLDLRQFPPPSSQNCKDRQGFQRFWHHHHHQNNHWGTRLWMSLRFIFFAIFLGDARKWFLAASKHTRRVRTSRQPVEP